MGRILSYETDTTKKKYLEKQQNFMDQYKVLKSF